MRAYVSCNCHTCRHASSKTKGMHKTQAHRTFRRQTKRAIRAATEMPVSVSTGYKD